MIFKISTREDDEYFSGKTAAANTNLYDNGADKGMPYGPMALPARKVELDLLSPDGNAHTH